MKPSLTNLVQACVEAHINSVTTKDALRQFRALIQHAYDLGVRDEKEENQGVKKESSQTNPQGQKSQSISQSRNEENSKEETKARSKEVQTNTEKKESEKNEEVVSTGTPPGSQPRVVF